MTNPGMMPAIKSFKEECYLAYAFSIPYSAFTCQGIQKLPVIGEGLGVVFAGGIRKQ